MLQSSEASFTKVSNILLEALYRFQCTALKKDILLFLIRELYGYHRFSAPIPLRKIARELVRDKARIGNAVRELIACNVILVKGRGGVPHPARILCINEKTWQWRPAIPPWETGEEKGRMADSEDHSQVDQDAAFVVAGTGHSCVDGSVHPDPAQTPENKGENGTLKKGLKKEKEIFMYDTCNIPPALKEVEGFREMYNKWCIYRQEISRPLTQIAIEVQFRKLLQYSSEGFSVIDIIERSISAGWPDLYRPGVRSESGSQTMEYAGVEDN